MDDYVILFFWELIYKPNYLTTKIEIGNNNYCNSSRESFLWSHPVKNKISKYKHNLYMEKASFICMHLLGAFYKLFIDGRKGTITAIALVDERYLNNVNEKI